MARFETVEENKVKVFFEVDGERFEEGLKYSYNKNKGDIALPGFRKGRVPRKLIEKSFGKEIFYEDAVNYVLPDAYEDAITGLELDIVSQPEFDIDNISAEEGVNFTAEVYIRPVVSVSDYTGLTYKPVDIEASEDEINKKINEAREMNSRTMSVTDRQIQDGDIAEINFEGFIDGVAFEGGKGENHELTIGSGTFIPGFEAQLIGHAVGDDVAVNVTFPEDYQSKDLAGKAALFKVEIKDIKAKELPELDDEFAQDVSEFDTLEEYKKDIEAKLREEKENFAKRDKESQLVEKLINKTEMNIPDAMIKSRVDEMLNQFAYRLASQGLSMEQFVGYTGQTVDKLREVYRADAESNIKTRLILEGIANQEAFEISPENIEEEIRKMAEEVAGTEYENISKTISEEEKKYLAMDLKVRKALELVMESAVPSEEEAAESAEEENLAEVLNEGVKEE